MITLDKVIIGIGITALALLLFPSLRRKPVTTTNVEATTDVLDSIVGESPMLGGSNTGVAIMTANVPWLFPPPLSAMLPVTGAAASPNAVADDPCGGQC